MATLSSQKSAGRGLRAPLAICFLLLGCAGPTPAPPPTPQPPASHRELARRYAPVIHQGAASTQDFITAVDFDGDWVGNNNWENQPTGDLSAHVYYSVVETETHWFLFYAIFPPATTPRTRAKNRTVVTKTIRRNSSPK